MPRPSSPPECKIPVLTTAPSEPYEVIAQVKTYGNVETDQAEMDDALNREACELGAQAVIVQPAKGVGRADEVSTHAAGSSDEDSANTVEYASQIVGLAIRYSSEVAPQQ
ncbi:MAG: hypothetical protein FJ147_11575 [Deltaproteobacteria bacterium]|nr:hypothetical protein [Deltaproteobacteria bacterium]